MKTFFHTVLDEKQLAVADLIPYKDGYYISRINVPKPYRGKGHESALLKEILDSADKEDLKLYLEINPYGELDYYQLKAWYKRHGLIEINTNMYMREKLSIVEYERQNTYIE